MTTQTEYDPEAVSVHYSNAETLIEESGQRQNIEAARECVSTAIADELHEIRVYLDRRNDAQF